MMSGAWGTVAALDGEYALIRMDDSGCGRCRAPGGCGGNNAVSILCRAPRTFRVPNPEHRVVGERVRVRVAEGAIGHGALHVYAVPLLALLLGALAGSTLADEAGAIAGAIAGLWVGWMGLRRVHRRSSDDPRFQPSIES